MSPEGWWAREGAATCSHNKEAATCQGGCCCCRPACQSGRCRGQCSTYDTVTQLRLKAVNSFWLKRSKGLLWSVCLSQSLTLPAIVAKPMTIHFLTGQKGATSEGKSFPESPCHTSAAETNWGWARYQAEQPSCSNTTKWAFEPLAVMKLIHILDKCLDQWPFSVS